MKHATKCDEVWHAGDWGNHEGLIKSLRGKTLRGVYGNIDSHILRSQFPEDLSFEIEGLKVYMIHIGGYPGKYRKIVKERLLELQPDLYVCGHSHICKIMKDIKLNLLHINPGAIGVKGFHKKRTMVKFGIDNGKLIDVQVLEYDRNV